MATGRLMPRPRKRSFRPVELVGQRLYSGRDPARAPPDAAGGSAVGAAPDILPAACAHLLNTQASMYRSAIEVKRLGAGDADLRPGFHQDVAVGGARLLPIT